MVNPLPLFNNDRRSLPRSLDEDSTDGSSVASTITPRRVPSASRRSASRGPKLPPASKEDSNAYLPSASFLRPRTVTTGYRCADGLPLQVVVPPWMDVAHLEPSKTHVLSSVEVLPRINPNQSIEQVFDGKNGNGADGCYVTQQTEGTSSSGEDDATSSSSEDSVGAAELDAEQAKILLQLQHQLHGDNEDNQSRHNGDEEGAAHQSSTREQRKAQREMERRVRRRRRATRRKRHSTGVKIISSRIEERRLEEKLHRNLGFRAVKHLRTGSFVVPAKNALDRTLAVATDIQNGYLRKKWRAVRDAFRFNGGIMSPKSLRVMLIRDAELTLMQVKRIEQRTKEELMEPGDKFVLYEDFRRCFKHPNERRQRRDSFNVPDSDESEEDTLLGPLQRRLLQSSSPDELQDKYLERMRQKKAEGKRIRKLKDKLSGRAHVRGELHRQDALQLLAGVGTSVKYLGMLESKCARNAKKRKIRDTPPRLGMQGKFDENIEQARKLTTSTATESDLVSNIIQIRGAAAAVAQSRTRAFLKQLKEMRRKADNFRLMIVRRWRERCFASWATWHGWRAAYFQTARPPFFRWARHCGILQRRRKMFSACFWPFRVWRKFYEARRLAREKALVLRRIWITYRQLACFRAFQRSRAVAMEQHRVAATYNAKRNKHTVTIAFSAWLQQTKYSEYVKKKWLAEGRSIMGFSKSLQQFLVLRVLWYYSHARRLCRQRARDNYLLGAAEQMDSLFGGHGLVADYSPPAFPSAQQAMQHRKLKNRRNMAEKAMNFDSICADIRNSYDRKERLMRRQIYFHFRTLMPRMLTALQGHVKHRRLKRLVWRRYCTSRSHRMWRTWRRFVFMEQVDRRDDVGVHIFQRSHSMPPGWPVGISRRQLALGDATVTNTAQAPPTAFDVRRTASRLREVVEKEAEPSMPLHGGIFAGQAGSSPEQQQRVQKRQRQQQRQQEQHAKIGLTRRKPNPSRRVSTVVKFVAADIVAEPAAAGTLCNERIGAAAYISVSMLERRRSLSQKILETALKEYHEEKGRRQRKELGLDVEERMARAAHTKREKKKVARAYIQKWNQELIEAEQRVHEARLDIQQLQRKVYQDKAEYRRYEIQVQHVRSDQQDTMQVANDILEEKRQDLNRRAKGAQEHGKRLYRMRAQMLHDVLCKVIDEVDHERALMNRRRCFARLRIMLLEKHALISNHRGRLKRYVEICTNLRRLNNSMPAYRRARAKRVTFAKWLAFLDDRYRYESPGLRQLVRRRAKRVIKFSRLLRERASRATGPDAGSDVARSMPMSRALSPTRGGRHPPARNVLHNAATQIGGAGKLATKPVTETAKQTDGILDEAPELKDRALVFARWLEWVQSSLARQAIVEAFRRRTRLKHLQRSFVALRDELRPQYTYTSRRMRPCFGIVRANYDLDKWKVGFLRRERALLTTWLRRYRGFVKRRVKRSAHSASTLKKVMAKQRQSMARRSELERRLLLSAFDSRGSFLFDDVKVRPHLELGEAAASRSNGPTVAQGMRLAMENRLRQVMNRANNVNVKDGRAHTPDGDHEGGGHQFDDDTPLPHVHSMVKEVVVFVAESVVQGIQLVHLDMETNRRIPGAIHGGQATQRHMFMLRAAQGEKLVGVEGVYTRFVARLRFHTSTGRSSQWFGSSHHGTRFMLGSRTAPTTTTTTTTTAKGDFVDRFIIGFHGTCTNGSLLELGAHMRNVVEKGVFVNCWSHWASCVPTTITRSQLETKENREFSFVLQMRAADLRLAFDRAQALARRMYKNKDKALKALEPLAVVNAVSLWLFNALTRGLVNVPDMAEEDFQALVSEGNELIKRGRQQVSKAKAILASIPGYSQDGNHDIGETVYGRAKARAMHKAIEEAEEMARKGEEAMGQGHELAQHGMKARPQIPDRPSTRKYFERLVELAQLNDSAVAIVVDEQKHREQTDL